MIAEVERPPRLSLARLWLRFLRFGCLAFGGPIAQIGMLRHELVDRERWTTPARFQRALAVYQALPGPEAHELCCWFGLLARGRIGALVAGLGFMLPGTLLMWACAWLYSSRGFDEPRVRAAFAGMQWVVLALIVRAVPRIGAHALRSRPAWVAAAAGAAAELAGLPLPLPLLFGALWLPASGRVRAAVLPAFALAAALWFAWSPAAVAAGPGSGAAATPIELLGLGLQAGLLTFGGAYTAIPIVRNQATVAHHWLTDGQFLDALAIGGVLPAPLIVFGTFVGFVAGGHLGALLLTIGIFAPAFGFTLIGHDLFERLVAAPRMHAALDGMAAAVVGLIAATAARLCWQGLGSPAAVAVAAAALLVVLRWRSPWTTPVVVAIGALAGLAVA